MATITLKGTEVTTSGELPKIGDTIKDFVLVSAELENKTLANFEGKKKILNIFPSIDTGICAASARKFNEEASQFENTVIINISKDLPFALGRFCAAEGIDKVETLSDFRGQMGEDFGLIMLNSPLQGLMARAVVVVDEHNKVIYQELVPEIVQEPNYEAALAVL